LNSDAFVDIPGEGNSDISGASGEAIDDFSGVADGDISGDDDKVNGATISLVNVDTPCENHHLGRVIGYLPCDIQMGTGWREPPSPFAMKKALSCMLIPLGGSCLSCPNQHQRSYQVEQVTDSGCCA
jgi:hypothetical protein